MLNSIKTFCRVFRLSPEIAFKKFLSTMYSSLRNNKQRSYDLEFCTFTPKPIWLHKIDNSFYGLPSKKSLENYREIILLKAENILEHKFDILGSGLIHVYHGANTLGVEGFNYSSHECFTDWKDWLKRHVSNKNFPVCYKISQNIDLNYKPIDWQFDFKSGYRWDELSWYKDINYGNVPGADIKVPWELGRMQYLINLVYASMMTKIEESAKTSDKYSYEFQNQIFGFISSNPPRFGTQWMSSMDVGIRATNWLVVHDLFKQNGVIFDDIFESVFVNSIYEHGLHILKNLEWSNGMRANHYLANIVSILFISAYLPVSESSTRWLAFSIQELINELYFQFLQGGGNFEASTSYHSFSAEMVFHGIALILSLPEDKISALSNYKTDNWIYRKKLNPIANQAYKIVDKTKLILPDSLWQVLHNIALFSYSISDNLGKTAQIGDNDSGRFLKLTPNYIKYPKETALTLFSNLDKYFENKEDEYFLSEVFSDQRVPLSIYAALTNCEIISKNENAFKPYYPKLEFEIINNMLAKHNAYINEVDEDSQKKFLKTDCLIIGDEEEESGIIPISFEHFGIYINKSYYYISTIRCGSIGQRGKGGHAHNDQLSLTLSVFGTDIIVDPGTYLYTALPDRRNLYRSTEMHNTLQVDDKEQNCWNNNNKDDLFWMKSDNAKARVLQFGDTIFIGEHYGFGKAHKRIISYNLNMIDGVDICEIPGVKCVNFHLLPGVTAENIFKDAIVLNYDKVVIEMTFENSEAKINDYYYSPSYGIIQKAKLIQLFSNENKIKWRIEIVTV